MQYILFMKKLFITSVLFFAAVSSLFAQKDVTAKAILNKVSEKYRAYNVVKTDFDFTLNNPQANIKETQSGVLTAQLKGNKFIVLLYSPGGKTAVAQEIISDGKTQWTYLAKDKEVQVNNANNSGDGLNPAQVFTIYEHGYKYLYTGEVKMGGKIYQQIDLTPEDIKKSFFKIRLTIDKVKKEIYSALIFDKNGNRYTYTLKTFVPNPPVTANTFSFDASAHKGVEVVDLR